MLTGAGGDGKTSVINSITGRGFIVEHIPTNAIETDSLCSVNVKNYDVAWNQEIENEVVMVENHIHAGIDEVTKDQINTDLNPVVHSSGLYHLQNELVGSFDKMGLSAFLTVVSFTINSMRADTNENGIQSEPSLDGTDANINPRLRKIFSAKNQENQDRKDQQVGGQSSKLVDAINTASVAFWDYAGQHVYHNIHHIFLRQNCVHALVIDLSKPLNSAVEIPPGSRMGFISQHVTYLQQIEFWLNTILSHVCMSTRRPNDVAKSVILVGTHKDLLHPNKSHQEERAEQYYHELLDAFPNDLHKRMIASFHAVDNKNGDPEAFTKLREKIMELVKTSSRWDKKQPIKWLLLKQKLYQIQQADGIPYKDKFCISLLKVNEFAREFKMNANDVKLFLEHSHLDGDLTYFNLPGLDQYVIPNAQWLIDVLKAIITLEQFYPQGISNETYIDLQRLKNEGLINVRSPLLDVLWKDFLQGDEAQEKQGKIRFLLRLMAQFDLLVFHSQVEKEDCIIPSLLPIYDGNNELSLAGFTAVAHPIYYRFHASLASHSDFKDGAAANDEFLPIGLFQRLMSKCAKRDGWRWADCRYSYDHIELHCQSLSAFLYIKRLTMNFFSVLAIFI